MRLGFVTGAVKVFFEPAVIVAAFPAFHNSTVLSPEGKEVLVNLRIGFSAGCSFGVFMYHCQDDVAPFSKGIAACVNFLQVFTNIWPIRYTCCGPVFSVSF